MRLGLLLVIVLVATVAMLGQPQSSQSPSQSSAAQETTPQPQKQGIPSRPVGKLTPLQPQAATPSKSIPCSQRLKVQTDTNSTLSKKVEALERENEALHAFANGLTARQEEESDRTEQVLKAKDGLIEKQRKLLEQYSTVSNALAGEMIASSVSGNWTIQTPSGRAICYVQLFEASHTIQLTNCN